MRAGAWALLVTSILAGCEGGPSVAPALAPIISGHRATGAEVGATVALVSPYDGYPFCTGTLVSPDVVLTAAHCLFGQATSSSEKFGPVLDASEVVVVVDAVDATTASEARWYEAGAVHVKETFPTGASSTDEVLSSEHDVGAIVLVRRVVGVTPVPILAPTAVSDELAPGRMLVAAGYGTTDRAGETENTELHVADVPFVRHSADELIAGVAGGSDTCYGDSGGPLYVDARDGLRVVGITSRGADLSTDRCDGGTVFTLAPAFLGWLEAATGETLTGDSTSPPPPPPPPPPDRADAGTPLPRRVDAGAPPPTSAPDSGVRASRPMPTMRSFGSGELTGGCSAAAANSHSRTSTTTAWLVVMVTAWALRGRRGRNRPR